MWQLINTADDETATAELTRCCGASRWVAGMLAARPFASLEAVYEQAEAIWWALEPADWLEAFGHHPQIGDVAELRRKFAATADLAGAEQAGVTEADEAVIVALAEGNAAYLAKFHYIFIVCATGKSAAEMLAILHGRLPNDPDVELPIAAEQQRQITFCGWPNG
jgi:2-oxo-4-hydroxy-4-carboxy-5-ureidoimidazoline decarboxylase